MVAGQSDYIKTVLKVKSNMDSGMFLAMQMAAIEALNNHDSWYDTVNSVYIRRRKIVEQIMDLLNVVMINRRLVCLSGERFLKIFRIVNRMLRNINEKFSIHNARIHFRKERRTFYPYLPLRHRRKAE